MVLSLRIYFSETEYCQFKEPEVLGEPLASDSIVLGFRTPVLPSGIEGLVGEPKGKGMFTIWPERSH